MESDPRGDFAGGRGRGVAGDVGHCMSMGGVVGTVALLGSAGGARFERAGGGEPHVAEAVDRAGGQFGIVGDLSGSKGGDCDDNG